MEIEPTIIDKNAETKGLYTQADIKELQDKLSTINYRLEAINLELQISLQISAEEQIQLELEKQSLEDEKTIIERKLQEARKSFTKSKLVNHDELYIKTMRRISKMTCEEIEKVIEEAKQGPTKHRPIEEAAIVAEICKIYATREVENMPPEELPKKGKELFKRHINSQQGKGDKLTQYEFALLAVINTASPIALKEIEFSEDER